MKSANKISKDLIREIYEYSINRCKEESIKNELNVDDEFDVIADIGINIGCLISLNCLNVLSDKKSREIFLLETIIHMTENLRENFELNNAEKNTH